MKVLLSIKPEFVERIFSGEKQFEYRKATFRQPVSTVVVYATQPVGKIVGEFDVGRVLYGNLVEIWEATKEQAGVSREFFLRYFTGRMTGYAIEVKKPRRYHDAIDPAMIEKFTAPQSFKYID